MKRSASAAWQGSLKEGKGSISTQSGILKEAQYGFNTRFEDGPDRKSTRLNSSHIQKSRMPSSA